MANTPAEEPAAKPRRERAPQQPPSPKKRTTATTVKPVNPNRLVYRTPRQSSPEPIKVGLPKVRAARSQGNTYHHLIMGEFIFCILLITLTPLLARNRYSTADSPSSDSLLIGNMNPYYGKVYRPADFVRLTSVCVLFFVLALMSNSPKQSKVAAMFGGLVTLGATYSATPLLMSVANIYGNVGKGVINVATAGTQQVNTPSFTLPSQPAPQTSSSSSNTNPGTVIQA